ncbi:MAG: tRNA pseudouridine(38-40) synthase TruA [Dysgonamonadaceae bacterium]|nr:tRNA pseudouridine(38-40) synthase TruA [Dysgonamonadaceae bacterium]MDD4604907.1 tRNA pseudouridine(38-40) synthase TruA [Dysgonamonadaceae bacterium]
MKRFFIILSYNGKKYCGWQIQPNASSVQQTLQEALSTLLRKKTDVVGAGRTDSGVHARNMIAHFDWDNDDFDTDELCMKLNRFLPKDISIHSIKEVAPDVHARFSAISRTYSYCVTQKKDPFLHEYKHRVFFEPDISLMNHLCTILLKTNDFTSFSKLHTDAKTNICNVKHARWEKKGEDYIFTIQADRFLRNMVRSIVGTLLQAGRGRLSEDDFRKIIQAKNRSAAGESAPAHALFLEKVEYPDDIWI